MEKKGLIIIFVSVLLCLFFALFAGLEKESVFGSFDLAWLLDKLNIFRGFC